MKLGFDARMYGLEHAGIGRYVMNLLDRLVEMQDLSLTLFISPKYADKFGSHKNVKVVKTTIRHYSLSEQTEFLSLLNKHTFDLLHVPHFNVPYFYNRPFVVTIHDILWHQVKGGNVTTLSPLKYYVKYQGYKLTMSHAVNRAKAIMVPSNYVKNDLIQTFSLKNSQRIHVTYEGVSVPPQTTRRPNDLTIQPYLLYVGSAYPHKNLIVVLRALQKLDLQLKIIGSRSVFLDQIKHQAVTLGVLGKIDFMGPQPDDSLVEILNHATALVHPSKSEGFGLTGLEAMAANCPVIAANATALPEIYGDAAIFFDPDNPADLVKKVDTITNDPDMRHQLITKGQAQAKKYSWDTMVDQTIALYNQLLTTNPPAGEAGHQPPSTRN
jgi:glycosyltransferase involved in cell wall biosynthesis